MKLKTFSTEVFGAECSIELMIFEKADAIVWKNLFDKWMDLKKGLKDYKAREPNLPEGLSEVAFCLFSNSGRTIKVTSKTKIKVSSSFDTFNIETKKAEQIKATSVASDLTSFGPKSKWDDLYFLDFYNHGKLDGTFNVYLIPNALIHQTKVNKGQTFIDQQGQIRRPRFSIIEKIIIPFKIKPLGENVKVW